MTNKHLHIVSLDVPFPADYGGAIDIFYRIKALHELGFQIQLHVFEYGRGQQKELEKYARVFYYKRKKSIWHLFSNRPFIVQSRQSKQLLARLLLDQDPILIEGLHCCSILEHPAIQQRTTLVRMHNIEHDYYRGLGAQSKLLRQLYFNLEAKKLLRYEAILSKCTAILAIKESDLTYYKNYNSHIFLLPASIPSLKTKFQASKRYALFQGNLNVVENRHALRWILKSLSAVLDVQFPLVVAGKISLKHQKALEKLKHVKLIPNPDEELMNQLIQEAHIHVLYTAVAAGIKLKLLQSMNSSGFILCNEKMVGDTAFHPFCVLANDPKEFKKDFIGLQNKVLDEAEFNKRQAFLQSHFNTVKNCEIIVGLVGVSH